MLTGDLGDLTTTSTATSVTRLLSRISMAVPNVPGGVRHVERRAGKRDAEKESWSGARNIRQ